MRLILDAGALIALDRNDRRVVDLVRLTRRSGGALVTSAPVIGQVWRHGGRQANLARALALVDVQAADDDAARRAGELLSTSETSDVVDALLVLLARPGDAVATSDVGDITKLCEAGDVRAKVIRV
jgi:hypothetical protein